MTNCITDPNKLMTCVSRCAAVFSTFWHARPLHPTPYTETSHTRTMIQLYLHLMIPVCLKTEQRLIRVPLLLSHFQCVLFQLQLSLYPDSRVLVKFIHLLLVAILHNDLQLLSRCYPCATKEGKRPEFEYCVPWRTIESVWRCVQFTWTSSSIFKPYWYETTESHTMQ